MKKQEKNIVIGGVMITALVAGGFSLSQGSMASADESYVSPTEQIVQTEVAETKVASQQYTSSIDENVEGVVDVSSEGTEESSEDVNSELEDSVEVNNIVEESNEEIETEDIREPYDTYDSGKEYVKGDRVIYSGKEYKAKWWTMGTNPTDGVDWEEVVYPNSDGSVNYSKGKHYISGDVVMYDGNKYEAQMWTESTPGSDSSWKIID